MLTDLLLALGLLALAISQMLTRRVVRRILDELILLTRSSERAPAPDDRHP